MGDLNELGIVQHLGEARRRRHSLAGVDTELLAVHTHDQHPLGRRLRLERGPVCSPDPPTVAQTDRLRLSDKAPGHRLNDAVHGFSELSGVHASKI